MLEEALSKLLSPNLRGRVITPATDEYEATRKVYNGMIDRHPDAIVRCANAADVRAAVNFACQECVTVAVRGGGHNGAGLGVCDHGLVIDLSPMKGVRVDPATKTVRAEAGCTQADLLPLQNFTRDASLGGSQTYAEYRRQKASGSGGHGFRLPLFEAP